MNKKDLVDAVVTVNSSSNAEATRVVDTVVNSIVSALAAGSEVSIHGLGKFVVKTTNARKGRNPKTGESIDIPAGKKVVFKSAKALVDSL